MDASSGIMDYFRRRLREYRLPFLGTPPPRDWRPSWLPFWMRLRSETDVHGHVVEEKAGLFLSNCAAGTEIEVLNWLHATVCLLKPSLILETGTAGALGTIALAAACRANGFGHVHTLELDPATATDAMKRVKAAGLAAYVSSHCGDSLEFLRGTTLRFDFAFFDSSIDVRDEEYRICLRRGLLSGPAIFHDTSPHRTKSETVPSAEIHAAYRQQLHEMAAEAGNTGYFESTLSRGLIAIFPRQADEHG